MIPTGKRYDYEEFTQMKKIGVSVLDNCFALKYPAEKAVFQLKSQVGTLQYWQESSPGKYPYVQLFPPPYRKSLAIEPMTCNVDAFNNHDNLICLNPGESTVARFGLEWMKG